MDIIGEIIRPTNTDGIENLYKMMRQMKLQREIPLVISDVPDSIFNSQQAFNCTNELMLFIGDFRMHTEKCKVLLKEIEKELHEEESEDFLVEGL